MKTTLHKLRNFSKTFSQSSQPFGRTNISIPEAIKTLSPMPTVPLSLKDLLTFGTNPTHNTLYSASQYLEREMPIRIARQIMLIDKLP